MTSQDLTRSMTFNVANAAVGPIRSVQNVLLIQVLCAAFITSLRPTTAQIAYPFPMVLLYIAISGSTPYFLYKPPNVSRNPLVHSSKIRIIPRSVAKSRTFCRKSSSGPKLRQTSILIAANSL